MDMLNRAVHKSGRMGALRTILIIVVAVIYLSTASAAEKKSPDVLEEQLRILEDKRALLAKSIAADGRTIHLLDQIYQPESEYLEHVKPVDIASKDPQGVRVDPVVDLMDRLSEQERKKIKLDVQIRLLEWAKEPIPPAELLKMRQEYVNRDPSVVVFTDTTEQLEQELVVQRQRLAPTDLHIRQGTELLVSLKARRQSVKAEAGKSFDDLVTNIAAEADNKKLTSLRTESKRARQFEEQIRRALSKVDVETRSRGYKLRLRRELRRHLESTKREHDEVVRLIRDLKKGGSDED